MDDFIRLLIPLMALSIPMIAVTGRFIVKPLVDAITRAGHERAGLESQQLLVGRIAALEDRLAGMERTLRQVQDAQSFQAQLTARKEPL